MSTGASGAQVIVRLLQCGVLQAECSQSSLVLLLRPELKTPPPGWCCCRSLRYNNNPSLKVASIAQVCGTTLCSMSQFAGRDLSSTLALGGKHALLLMKG